MALIVLGLDTADRIKWSCRMKVLRLRLLNLAFIFDRVHTEWLCKGPLEIGLVLLLLRLCSIIICHYIDEIVLTCIKPTTFSTIALRKHELNRRKTVSNGHAGVYALVWILSLGWHVAWNYGPASISSSLKSLSWSFHRISAVLQRLFNLSVSDWCLRIALSLDNLTQTCICIFCSHALSKARVKHLLLLSLIHEKLCSFVISSEERCWFISRFIFIKCIFKLTFISLNVRIIATNNTQLWLS